LDDSTKEPESIADDVDRTDGPQDAGQDGGGHERESGSDDLAESPAEEEFSARRWLAPGSARFVLVFITFVVAIFLTFNHFKESAGIAKYMSMLATQVAFVLRLITDGPVKLDKPLAIITYGGFSTRIIPDCGAIPSISIFTAAVLAFPARVRYKVVGIVCGLPLLYVVNVCRLTCLALIGAHWPLPVFKFSHIYVWQTIFIVFVVVIWFFWIEVATSEGKTLSDFVRHIWKESRLAFALRFVCFGALFLTLFVLTLPVYAWIMVHVAGFCLDMLAGYDIRHVAVDGAYGIRSFALNATFIQKVLNLQMAVEYGHSRSGMLAAELAFTLTPFLALVAATARVKWRRRLAAAAFGLGIMMTWQLVMFCTFFVSAVSFGVTRDAHFVRAMGFVNAVLPFLLWSVMLAVRQIPAWSTRRSREERVADGA